MNAKKAPVRMCVACRQGKAKNELIRIVKKPDGQIVIDPAGKVNGRGAYLCKSGDCIAQAQKKQMLSRAFKTNVEQAVYERLKSEVGPDGQNDTA